MKQYFFICYCIHPTTKVSIALVGSINIKFEGEMLGKCIFVKVVKVNLLNNMSMVSSFLKNVKFVLIILEI